MRCRATRWSGRLVSSSMSPWAARPVKFRHCSCLTCDRLREAAGRSEGPDSPGLPGGWKVLGTAQLWAPRFRGSTLSLTMGPGIQGDSLVEEQQVRGLCLEVSLEAMLRSQVCQAAELGRQASGYHRLPA